MSNVSVYDELDQAIDQMLAAPEAELPDATALGELVAVASELRDLPRDNFKTRLRLELEWEAAGRTVSVTGNSEQSPQPVFAGKPEVTNTQSLPGLFGKVCSGYPVRRSNMALSFALHVIMVLAVGAGFVMVKSTLPRVDTRESVSVRLDPYPFPVGAIESHGGGNGGAAEKTPASKGIAPRSAREQLTPPIVVRNFQPIITAEATVIAPPELTFPRTRQIGDPLSALSVVSNGPGAGGGIGGNTGDGVGGGRGPGRGSGINGGCCDGPYAVGYGVSMPRAIYSPEPEFSEEARRMKHQGEVTLLATIGADGLPKNLTVVRSLGMGLDEKALEMVKTWRFDPARKDGRPVAVQMNIIVNFHLY
jgi:periplasmic protein TonB